MQITGPVTLRKEGGGVHRFHFSHRKSSNLLKRLDQKEEDIPYRLISSPVPVDNSISYSTGRAVTKFICAMKR